MISGIHSKGALALCWATFLRSTSYSYCYQNEQGKRFMIVMREYVRDDSRLLQEDLLTLSTSPRQGQH